MDSVLCNFFFFLVSPLSLCVRLQIRIVDTKFESCEKYGIHWHTLIPSPSPADVVLLEKVLSLYRALHLDRIDNTNTQLSKADKVRLQSRVLRRSS